MGFPGGSTCEVGDTKFDPWAGKIPLEQEMATHPSILASGIQWTKKPGGLQSRGYRVRHGLATETTKKATKQTTGSEVRQK